MYCGNDRIFGKSLIRMFFIVFENNMLAMVNYNDCK